MALENNGPKTLAENLYKQGVELAAKNKVLTLFDQLYALSILTLEPGDLAKRIVQTIQGDFSFELVSIFLYDLEHKKLQLLASAQSERFKGTTDFSESPFLNEVVINGKMGYSEDLINNEHIRASLAYPLVSDNKIIGVLLLSLNRTYKDLVEYEKKSIESFINVIAVALDKALLYKQLKETNIELGIANEGQTNLIHIINHQIKGYLAKARNIFSELLSTPEYGPISDSAKPMLQEGFKSLTEGVDFVQDFLTASNIEKGTFVYNMQPMDFGKIVTEVAEKQKDVARGKGLTLELDIVSGDYNMKGDASQLGQAVRNLIDNSIKYTPTGGLKLNLEKIVNKILLTIKDTGVGISEELKPKLFTKGGRDKDSIKINVNSTGFGLSFVKGVVEAHQGRVWAESAGLNKGSTFYMELPIS